MGCEFSESCVGGGEPGLQSWHFWLCLSLLLLLLLLGLLGCCLRCWLGRPRRPAAQNSLVIFAVGETESLHGNEEPPWTPAQRPPPHLQTPGWSTVGSSSNALAWNGSLQPPPYEELMKPGRTLDLSSRQDGFHR
ncbi:transmembrane protein 207 [Ahaetulla prasina]|uniref:transmembrane protein 207 n=1 Tax=Ahaetulla prasina TaxID=499056 RepID=UPI0026498ADD|nr:transmembrane protein 207 [Ahaetulla prasina]